LAITRQSKDVIIKERTISGTIDNSLYQTLMDENASPLLAVELADVFAWQIDFYTIQKGDKFFAVYNEKYVGDDFVGIGKILTAEFIHQRNSYKAFLFNQDGKDEYFDEEGKSLQKEFLKAPLKYRRISSRFSRRRLHPIFRVYRPHLGIDYAAATGTPVQAVGDGIVILRQRKGGAGRFVKIRHNSVYTSGYMHLSRYGKGIRVGKKVKQGQVIGYVGSSGHSTGPHLDFRFYKNGRAVNYMTQKFPSSKSVSKENLSEFYKVRDSLMQKLKKFDNSLAISTN
jgi:murein DD-endopeptidase MepM/ murein hydrolase activator NlpD